MVKLSGRKPSPRILVLSESPDRVPTEELERLAPTVRAVSSMSDIRAAEWDAVVTDMLLGSDTAPHLFIIGVGVGGLPLPEDRAEFVSYAGGSYLGYGGRLICSEFIIPDELSAAIERLVQTDLLPLVESWANRGSAVPFISQHTGSTFRRETPPAVEPFLLMADGQSVAGRYLRQGEQAEAWLLPAGVNVAAWLAAALELWNEYDAERFPRRGNWTTGRRWLTARESELLEKLDRTTTERDEAVAAADAHVAEARKRLDAATVEASMGEKRLLSAQGADLVQAVVGALQELGFRVVEMDLQQREGDKLEDLQIRVDAEEWIAISEVRGYKKGAKLSDLGRLQGRFKGRFIKENGREPNAMWHFVNHFIDEDPDAREAALRSNPDDVEVFAEDGGLIIETPELFKLLQAVRTGALTAEDARASLRGVSGRYTAPTTASA